MTKREFFEQFVLARIQAGRDLDLDLTRYAEMHWNLIQAATKESEVTEND
jgi:hypothetical protein